VRWPHSVHSPYCDSRLFLGAGLRTLEKSRILRESKAFRPFSGLRHPQILLGRQKRQARLQTSPLQGTPLAAAMSFVHADV
jgi:hypothetical protein